MKSSDYSNITIRDLEYEVIVLCLTYNQSNYVVETLDGFSNQKTRFPFLCLIIDDASTDGEPNVIHDWLESNCDNETLDTNNPDVRNIYYSKHYSNKNCIIVTYFLRNNLYNNKKKFEIIHPWIVMSKYIAFCEGDDYWTDIFKLQKQYDALSSFPQINICIHNFTEVDAKTGSIIQKEELSNTNTIFSVKDVILEDFVSLNTFFISSRVLSAHYSFINIYPIDYSLLIYASLEEGCIYLSENMSVYRRNVDGSWCDSLVNSDYIYRAHSERVVEMLSCLDKETYNKYHNIIKARQLIESCNTRNTKMQNLRNVIQYRQGFKELNSSQLLKVLIKLIVPQKVCRKISQNLYKQKFRRCVCTLP